MDKTHTCKQLQRYQQDTRKGQYRVGVATTLEIVRLDDGQWYRVDGDDMQPVACCTFCGKKLG